MDDWVDLIGVPFQYGGRGPEIFDCYGLVIEMYRRRGRWLPDYRSPSDQAEIAALMGCASIGFRLRLEPTPSSIVMLRVSGLACHVGYMLDEERFLHTWERSGGVVVERLENWRRRVTGFYDYEH
jgi:cell wall-associated NlpC family hydrolase